MSIKSRINKAKQASKSVVLCSDFNKFRKSYGQRSLTDASVNYQQTLVWGDKDTIEDVKFLVVKCQCQKVDAKSATGMIACEGNSNGTICYHCLAALMFAASQEQQTLSLFDDFSTAFNYQKLGGQLIKVISGQGDGKAWAVVKAHKPVVTPAPKLSFTTRVNLLRGEVEKGIE